MELDVVLKTVEMGRRFAQLGEMTEACQWYAKAVAVSEYEMPELLAEAGEFILRYGDYKVAYTFLLKAFEQGYARDGIFDLLAEAFYYPNVEGMAKRYRYNVTALAKYPYLFQKDFPKFENLGVKFFPYEEGSYLPFDLVGDDFGALYQVDTGVIDRYFFGDMDKPILAEDVYSQHQLSYLYDMVRKSEWYAGDNHIYLYYSSFAQFAQYLQVLDFTPLLKDQKFVFLFGEERALYPLDFKAQFGIDYASMTPKPLGVREVKKMVWHVQGYCHTGGDFFNEVLDNHPYLLTLPSIIYDGLETVYEDLKPLFPSKGFLKKESFEGRTTSLADFENMENLLPSMLKILQFIKGVTKKDWFVALWLAAAEVKGQVFTGRIVPAFFYQPHFTNTTTEVAMGEEDNRVTNNSYELLSKDPLFKSFSYVKSFIPVRRFTTSLGAACRFSYNQLDTLEKYEDFIQMYNHMEEILINRSYEVDAERPIFRDMVAIRFEDGKLNPRATFGALCGFLDIPWADTMLHPTVNGVEEEYNAYGSVAKGFDLHPVYNDYEEYLGEEDKYILEFLLRPRMEQYGYKTQFYQGAVHTVEEIVNRLLAPTKIHQKQREIVVMQVAKDTEGKLRNHETMALTDDELIEWAYTKQVEYIQTRLIKAIQFCLSPKPTLSPEGHKLSTVPLLAPKAELLERPLYE